MRYLHILYIYIILCHFCSILLMSYCSYPLRQLVKGFGICCCGLILLLNHGLKYAFAG